MEKKKNSSITEIIVTVIVVICLGLIVMQLTENINNKVYEINESSTLNQ